MKPRNLWASRDKDGPDVVYVWESKPTKSIGVWLPNMSSGERMGPYWLWRAIGGRTIRKGQCIELDRRNKP